MGWVSLFSGGKDSAYAYYRAQETGRDVDRLVTVHTSGDSYMYHVPTTELTRLAADSIGLPLVEVSVGDLGAESATDASRQGDAEIEPLETRLATLTESTPVTGVVAGAVESEYQTSRLEAMCDRLDLELYAPLWQRDPRGLADDMLAAGFEIMVVQVAAGGLDESWLGRTLDAAAFDELETLGDSHGVHLLGEGGEFETLVTDGPHMDAAIQLEYDTVWEGDRGHLTVQESWLAT